MFVNDLEYSMSCLVLRVLVEQKVGLRGKALDDELILILQPFASSILFDDFETIFSPRIKVKELSPTYMSFNYRVNGLLFHVLEF